MKKTELSVVVLSYNTKDLLKDCLLSLRKVKDEAEFEIIVVDNASNDGSIEMVERDYPEVKLIKNDRNLGFAAGNNQAREFCHGGYILFLNSDTVIKENVVRKSLAYIKSQPKIGVLTCKMLLPDGSLDKDARRSFITPWVGLTRLFFKASKNYWYENISPDITHEIDVAQGAFFLTRKKILDDLGWWDEDYYLDGEDIDLCWRIKEKGWKIVYYPEVSIIHIKGASKGKQDEYRKKISFQERIKFRNAGVDSMEIFYRKRLWSKYPLLLNLIVLAGIKIVKLIRIVRTVVGG